MPETQEERAMFCRKCSTNRLLVTLGQDVNGDSIEMLCSQCGESLFFIEMKLDGRKIGNLYEGKYLQYFRRVSQKEKAKS